MSSLCKLGRTALRGIHTSAKHQGGGPWFYRTIEEGSDFGHGVVTFVTAVVTFKILYKSYYHWDHVLPNNYPDVSKWTDEELGVKREYRYYK